MIVSGKRKLLNDPSYRSDAILITEFTLNNMYLGQRVQYKVGGPYEYQNVEFPQPKYVDCFFRRPINEEILVLYTDGGFDYLNDLEPY